jgi:uncharacterized protein (DUF608 family)
MSDAVPTGTDEGRPASEATAASDCCGGGCSCEAQLTRRSFLTIAGAAAATVMAAGRSDAVFLPGDEAPTHLVPLDKHLDPAWLASLRARGEQSVYRGWEELKYIGMPVGGICAGQVYLGGDGQLWLWDIFNKHHEGVVDQTVDDYFGQRVRPRDGSNYIEPPTQVRPFRQGFALRYRDLDGEHRVRLSRAGVEDIEFRGTYPIGEVTYKPSDCPLQVRLSAYSPFVPLHADDSGLPATILEYEVENLGDERVEADIVGWLQNPVLHDSFAQAGATRRNRAISSQNFVGIEMSAHETAPDRAGNRPDIPFEDFEDETYQGWTATGTAFGDGPTRIAELPGYQGDVAGEGEGVVNSHNTRQGEDIPAGDAHVGTLTSDPFTINRDYLNFRIGGGRHPNQTCLNLMLGDKVVRSATGADNNRMRFDSFDVAEFAGREARLQIVDAVTGAWGNIGVDDIVFSDHPRRARKLEDLPDYGTMALGVLCCSSSNQVTACATAGGVEAGTRVVRGNGPVGHVSQTLELEPGQRGTVAFAITWHFPSAQLPLPGKQRRWYAGRFQGAADVADYVATNYHRLRDATHLWRDTWYDSTLPWWLLDRSFANTCSLATNTCYRLDDGRFWAWEGIGCCAGTCTHVWHYAQAVGRVFPELERDLRERVDYGIGLDEDTGRIRFRAENNNRDAADGQAGVIMRTYREHLMSPDDGFLQRVWPSARQALRYLMDMDAADGSADGMIEGEQHNTLDAEWYGKIPAIASLYLSALECGRRMAEVVEDADFAGECTRRLVRGRKQIAALFNGEYFIQHEDPAHLQAIGIGTGCHIDQVFGQSWGHQLALGRLFDRDMTHSALRSLWNYNFNPDMGPLRESLAAGVRGRPYAVAGDAGLLMCTWPQGGRRSDWERHWQYGYFNECMSGFEYQVASHMIYEDETDLVDRGLAVARAIHDRYHPRLRNPYNEIECSDHYARAMASYGVFLAACGFAYDGPRGHLAFEPRIRPEQFRAAFTAAAGWGTLVQERADGQQHNRVLVRFGELVLRSLSVRLPAGAGLNRGDAVLRGEKVQCTSITNGDRVTLEFESGLTLTAGEALEVQFPLDEA